MKLYKITATLSDGTVEKKWAGSQSDAAKTRKHFNSERKVHRDNITTEEVEVSTHKGPLIDFLNGL